MYESDAGCISIALLGDISPTRRLAVFREERFLKLRDLLNSVDAVFANMEGSVHKYLDDPHAQRPSGLGGTYGTIEPHVLEDIKWLGIDMLACGSTHADDYGPDGIMQTIRYLDEAGIVHAGSGRHLAEARAPGFLDTPRGRVALIATTAHFNPGGRAGAQRHDTLGYPGVNAVRHHGVYEVDPETMELAKKLGQAIAWDVEQARRGSLADKVPDHGQDAYSLLDHTFVPSEALGFKRYADESDIEGNVRQVRYAKEMADSVIVSMHTHDLGGPSYLSGKREDPPEFMVELAKQSIDAGADVFVGHGGPSLGVELYQGKPILYGLSTFIGELSTVQFLPEHAYERYGLGADATPADFVKYRYEHREGGGAERGSAFAVCDFEGPGVAEIRLYPIQVGGSAHPRWQRGRPMLAQPEIGRRAIEHIGRLSEKYGTKVDYEDGIGVIHP